MSTLPINTIINGECVSEMKKLPNSCIDLIIADPPYNLSKGGEWKWDNSVELQGMGGNWNKAMQKWDDFTLESYMAFTKVWLAEAKRILKPTGSMWIFGTYHNMGVINVTCQMLGTGFPYLVKPYPAGAYPALWAGAARR